MPAPPGRAPHHRAPRCRAEPHRACLAEPCQDAPCRAQPNAAGPRRACHALRRCFAPAARSHDLGLLPYRLKFRELLVSLLHPL
jgi:hypothetical protein